MPVTFLFSLPEIGCIKCMAPIEEAVKGLPSVLTVTSNALSKTLKITVQESELSVKEVSAMLKDVIERCGQPAIEIFDSAYNSDDTTAAVFTHSIKGVLGVLLGLGIMALPLLGVALPVLALGAIASFCTLATFYLGKESFQNALYQFYPSKTLTMDTLFSISSLVVIGVSIASLFVPYLPMMFETGLLIFGFKHLGMAIEASLKEKVIDGLSFKDRAVITVLRKNTQSDEWENCLSTDLQEGDLIEVKGGETIPVDALCEQASARIITTILTGKTRSELMPKGSLIYAGMKVHHKTTSVQLRVLKTTSASLLHRLDQILAQTDHEKAPIVETANKFLVYFIPMVIIVAALSGVVIGTLFSPILGIQCLISVLVTACPCTLGLITPLALHIGLSKAFSHGVKFTSQKAMEQANDIDTVIFDLNGTLTTGIPVVTDYGIDTQSKLSKEEFFGLLACIEKNAMHPIGAAIQRYSANLSQWSDNLEFIADTEANHSGMSGYIDNVRYLVGNSTLLAEHGIDLPIMRADGIESEHIIYLARSGRVLGFIRLKDPLREDAKFTLDELARMGKTVWICTGADEVTALRYAKVLQVPRDHVLANALGHSENNALPSKSKLIADLKQQGRKVAMIGDAANDAVAIAKSDFGIAVLSATSDSITQQCAGAHIYNASLLPVITAFSLASQTLSSIKQNLTVSLAYNIVALSISGGAFTALGLSLNPAIGVVLMFAQTALILLNQYRIKQQALPYLSRFQHDKSLQATPVRSSYAQIYQDQYSLLPTKAQRSDPADTVAVDQREGNGHVANYQALPVYDDEAPVSEQATALSL